MLKILIADDHELVRIGIRQILLDGFAIVEIAEAFDTPSLVKKAFADNWDIIISDYAMPGGGGMKALQQIKKQKPDQPILILSIYPEDQYAIQVITAGASGFLNKDTVPEELINAVKIVLSGRRYIQPRLAKKMSISQRQKAGILLHELLCERELGIMRKLVSGFSISEIAVQLNLTIYSVNIYQTHIMDKLDVGSNAELYDYVKVHNLL